MAAPLRFHLPTVSNINERNALYFYPDVLDYQFNRRQYQGAWAKLHQERGGYLIVKHGQLDSVGWLRYSFERVKGWFGFSNNCLPTKVKMAAQKLAYFGYLNEFNQGTVLDVISGWAHQYQPEQAFIERCKKNRNIDDSSHLQEQLIAFYQEHAQQLDAVNNNHVSSHRFKFGTTYATHGHYIDMLHIDVQDEGLINMYLPSMANGNDTLAGSTCRRLYVNRKLREIDKILCEFEKKSAEASGLLGRVWRHMYQQPKQESLALANLNQEADIVLALWPELEVDYANILIRLKLAFGCQLKEDIRLKQGFGHHLTDECSPSRMKSVYQDAYRMMNKYCNSVSSFQYLQNYFIDDEGFALCDVDSPLIKSWGEHLFQTVLPKSSSSEKNHLYTYRIAQIRPDLIPSESLETYINSCLKEHDYVLAFKFISRLSETKIDIAAQYLCDNRANLHAFVTQDNPLLSKAYSKKLVAQRNTPVARVVSFFSSATDDSEYEVAVSKHPSVEYCEAAPYYLRKYVKENNWEKARALLINREKDGLEMLDLPIDAITLLAKHYTDEGDRLYGEGRLLREENHDEEAVKRYSDSLSMMEVAEQVMPSDEHRHNLNVHRRLLAGIIIDRKPLTIENVDKALTYLEDIEKTLCIKKDEFLEKVYINALEHRVNFLYEACLGAAYGEFDRATDDHIMRCKKSLSALPKSLNKLISLREDYNDAVGEKGVNRTRLAALHFLKAEFIFYFKVGLEDATLRDQKAYFHYEKACAIEPNQSFYHLCYSRNLPYEQTELASKVKTTGRSLLEQCGATYEQFNAWFEERWQRADERIDNIDLPKLAVIPTSRSWWLF